MEPVEPTHTVAALRTYLFPAPDLKTPPLDMLSLGAAVTVTGTDGKWSAIAGGGHVYTAHLLAPGAHAADPVDTALRFMEAPYLWGGRTSLGLDCSALVQLALAAAGVACPRDSDQQAAAIGALVATDGAGHAFGRGDIVFFPGHVGIMADATDLIHANAFHMRVTREPLADVVRRAGDKGITAVRRLG
jgi:cell wall-associated NlpC family hydrolase